MDKLTSFSSFLSQAIFCEIFFFENLFFLFFWQFTIPTNWQVVKLTSFSSFLSQAILWQIDKWTISTNWQFQQIDKLQFRQIDKWSNWHIFLLFFLFDKLTIVTKVTNCKLTFFLLDIWKSKLTNCELTVFFDNFFLTTFSVFFC